MNNFVIITSVINISKNPLSYTNTRSVFSPEERYEQTLKTISSVREKIPDSKILLVESTEINKEMSSTIKELVDYFIIVNDKSHVINGPFKGAAETTQILESLRKIDFSTYQNIFKISGRYWLNDKFDYSKFENEKNIFQKRSDTLATVFYKISDKDLYLSTLEYCSTNPNMLELNFYERYCYNYNNIEILGVEGFVSVDGNFISY